MEDAALISIFEAIDAYLEAQQALSAALKAGHLSLAQTKYSLKPGALSQSSYPAETQASTTVKVSGTSPQKLELSSTDQQLASAVSKKQPQHSEDADASRGSDKHRAHTSNPVAWFAPLPPPSLPAAQQSFSKALQQAVAAVNSLNELRHKMATAGLTLEPELSEQEHQKATDSSKSTAQQSGSHHRSSLECSSSAVLQLLADMEATKLGA